MYKARSNCSKIKVPLQYVLDPRTVKIIGKGFVNRKGPFSATVKGNFIHSTLDQKNLQNRTEYMYVPIVL